MSPALPVARLGRGVLAGLAALGRVAVFAVQVVSHLLRPPFYPREFAQQLLQIGWLSLPVVGLTALFTGGALALQIYAGGARFNAESVVPSIVAIGMVRELGPVLGGLMVAARVASSIAAELGTMKVTEQVDALETLAVDVHAYLVVPRVVAATLMFPVVTAMAITVGVISGWITATNLLDLSTPEFFKGVRQFYNFKDVWFGLVKSASFGCAIALTGALTGLRTQGGAEGVGRSTTRAVVLGCEAILVLDAFWALVLL